MGNVSIREGYAVVQTSLKIQHKPAGLIILAEAEIGVMVYEEREGGYQVCFDIDFEDLRDIEVVEAELFGIVIEDHGYPALAEWLIEEETLVQAAFDNAAIDPSDLDSGD